MDPKFYYCKHCKKVLLLLVDSGTPTICCGEEMELLTANTTDAAQEKHVPVIKIDGDKVEVTVGSVPHPMVPEHYITFIYLLTEKGFRVSSLKPGDEPKAEFNVAGDKVVAAYEYCNLHGLWKATA